MHGNMPRSSRLSFSQLGLFIFLAFLVLQPANVFARKTSVLFWTTEVATSRFAVINYLSQVFMLFNPDIDIRVQGVEENLIANTLKKAFENDTQPDLISCCSDIVVALNENKWMNRAGAASVVSAIGRNRFYAGALNKLQLSDGQYCGIPYNGWIQGIWYRKDWFREHDLAPPDTWTNILRAAQKLHNPEAGRYGILLGTRGDVYAEQIFTHLALSMGVREFSPDGTVVFNSPSTLKTLQFYKKLAQYSPPGAQSWRGRDFYLQGKLAMMFYSTFIMDDLAIPSVAANSLTSEHFSELEGALFDPDLVSNTAVVTTIQGIRPASYGIIHALGIIDSTDTEKKEAVIRFIHFLFSKDAYISWLHMVPGGMLPVLKGMAGSDSFCNDLQGVFQKYSRRRIAAIISGFNSLKSFSFIDGHLIPQAAQASAAGILPEMISNTLQKGMPPENALAIATEQMRSLVARKKKYGKE